MRIDLTAIQVKGIVAHLCDELGEDDDRLLIDMLEGETDLFELVARLLNMLEAEEGAAAALKSQIDDRQARKLRCEARVRTHREAIMALMEAARQDKLVLPEATLSVREIAAKLAVNDPNAVPDEYTVSNPKPDLEKIKSAFAVDGDLPNWLRVEPAKPSLTIRRK